MLKKQSSSRSKITEKEHQKKIVKWCRSNNILVIGSASGVYFHGNFATINLLKSLAIISDKGTPDIFIPKVKKNEMGFIISAGLFIELKKEGGVASEEQLTMIDKLQDEGYHAFIVEGSDMAIDIIKDYLNI